MRTNPEGQARRTTLAAALGAGLLALSGCGTVLNGTRQAIPIASDPPGATASWNGQAVETPGSLVVRRTDEDVLLRFEKAGYLPCIVRLERHKNGAFWANLAWIPAGIAAGAAIGANSTSRNDGFQAFQNAGTGAVVGTAVVMLGAMGVDVATGGGNTFRPGSVTVVLKRLEGGEGALPEAPPGREPACSPVTP